MALIDLDKIIIKRTILRIRCTACGGNLVVSSRKSIAGRLARVISFGAVKPESYVCETCKKTFLLL
jgi:DNA-directed RNA polymerase subunit RPC12/RpoP